MQLKKSVPPGFCLKPFNFPGIQMAEGVGLPPAKQGALRDFVNDLLRATSAFKPMASRLGSHPTPGCKVVVAKQETADFLG